MATQAERRAATRRRIVAAARQLFVERGYVRTTTSAILDTAGVSRGALYHHFASKEDVFAAVFEEVTVEAIASSVTPTGEDGSPTKALLTGCLAWLDTVSRPETATILLDQGPAVLGWSRCRDIDESHSLRLMQLSVRAAEAAGEIETTSVELTARVINAALAELAMAVAHDPGGGIEPAAARATITALIDALTLPRS